MRPRLIAAASAAAALALAGLGTALPASAHTTPHRVALAELNNSGVSGQVTVLEQHGRIRVNLTAHGLEAGQVHPEHIHGFVDGDEATCPTPDLDTDGDGLISFVEGLPAYGPVVITLGVDETPGSTLSYSRTFTETDGGEPTSSLGPLADFVVIVHGLTVDGSYEPSLPVACAALDVAGR